MIVGETAIESDYPAYLSDESKLRGARPPRLYFPLNAAEVASVVRYHSAEGTRIRVSGARTGLAGAAVPEPGEVVITLEKLRNCSAPVWNEDLKRFTVQVEAGVTLRDLNEYLREWGGGWYFPVDPTETSASIGGMVSTNASGSRSFRYGDMRRWVQSLLVVLADGSSLEVSRSRDRLRGNKLELAGNCLELSPIHRPKTKATLGYFYEPDGAVLDLFVGAEGTLGIACEVELALEPVAKQRLSFMQFFRTVEAALHFVELARSSELQELLAIEFYDRRSLLLACESSQGRQAAPAQLVGESTEAAVSLEIVFTREDDLETLFSKLETLVGSVGANIDESYAGVEEKELREIKTFRHAVPEQINATIAKRKLEHPELHKIATDMAVPDTELRAIYALYHDRLLALGLDFAIFGHAGNNHFHVNILPRDGAELAKAKECYRGFAEEVVKCGGAVAAEHGIGKLKRDFLEMQYSAQELDTLRAIKQFFDPQRIFNQGVLFRDTK